MDAAPEPDPAAAIEEICSVCGAAITSFAGRYVYGSLLICVRCHDKGHSAPPSVKPATEPRAGS
jgi:hypothetical protein